MEHIKFPKTEKVEIRLRQDLADRLPKEPAARNQLINRAVEGLSFMYLEDALMYADLVLAEDVYYRKPVPGEKSFQDFIADYEISGADKQIQSWRLGFDLNEDTDSFSKEYGKRSAFFYAYFEYQDAPKRYDIPAFTFQFMVE